MSRSRYPQQIGEKGVLALVVFAAVVIAALLVYLVPIGEAPDEPAHLTYVEHIVRYGTLPEVEEAPKGFHYESHQPPLAYLLMAVAVRISGFTDLTQTIVRDPDFHFERGARALLEPPDSPTTACNQRAVRTARAVNLGWLAVIEIMILLMCLKMTSSFATTMASALPFCLAPQLLFSCATTNNDAAVIALSSVAIYGLFTLVTSKKDSQTQVQLITAMVVSIAAGLALWSKITAVFLVPGITIVAAILMKNQRWKTVAALLGPGVILTVAWVGFSLARTGSIVPLPAELIGNDPGGMGRLFAEPSWILSVWGGFWAKLGWFNLPLPTPLYLAFLPASLLALTGFFMTILERRFRSTSNLLLASTVLMNVVILITYMVRVDWQPQGRYLLPSIVAIAGLSALGFEWLSQSLKANAISRIAAASATCASVVAVTTLVVVATNY